MNIIHLAIGGLGPGEIVIVVLVLLLLFGAAKIPKLMRSMGSGIGEFKKGLKESNAVDLSDDEDAKESDEKPAEKPAEKK
jgi:sec-independent protein translocase protein TatA